MSDIATFADDLLWNMLAQAPELGAELGIATVNGRPLPPGGVPDFSDVASADRARLMAEAREALTKIEPPTQGEDRVTYDVLSWLLENGWFEPYAGRAGASFPAIPYPVNHLNGHLPTLLMTLAREADSDARECRLAAASSAIDDARLTFEARIADGWPPPRQSLVRAISDMRALLRKPIPRIAAAVAALLDSAERALPEVTADAGLWDRPYGDEHYAWLLQAHTTTPLDSDAVHELGLQHTARVQAEIRGAFDQLGLKGETVTDLYARISGSEFRFADRAAAFSQAEQLTRGLEQAAAVLFDMWPASPIVLSAIPETLEESQHTRYSPPATDGTRPGLFEINLRAVTSRPRWELPVLCAHEGVPGHHLQLAVAQRLPLPAFRRAIVFTAYIEGWAKYAETLLDRRLMNDPYVSLGRLRGELYSMVNLALDTGLHARRWSREQGIRFFRRQTGVDESFAAEIVDRALVTPGQLCAYAIGLIKMRALGAGRDLRDRHRQLLRHGALPLSVLESLIEREVA